MNEPPVNESAVNEHVVNEHAASEPLVKVSHLKKYFPVRRGLLARVVGHVKAVDDLSFDIQQGECRLLKISVPSSGRDVSFVNGFK